MNTDSVSLILLSLFAVPTLVLVLLRSLLDDLDKTVRAWRRLRDTWRERR